MNAYYNKIVMKKDITNIAIIITSYHRWKDHLIDTRGLYTYAKLHKFS